ncbi:hypothetical protein E2605_07010 [Dysgonomonas capnocytophagoides]|uniref:Uncharacterized protein n=1 Tax=Dysgonomonas capnocytophagoides TaxID=45254 RepID=A0A4Y8L407_9BACT|nr:hypothetical protein [Dysgonomonas capnocytophagoides]TFD97409.1 hypothetical protein E2605_07010 [Dysgonomonas capnocytophagoides]
MKKYIWLIILPFMWINNTMLYAQIGINTESPNQTSVLDITSSNKGLLIPRMSNNEKTAIASPAAGLLVYDTDLKCISQNIGSTASPKWTCLTRYNRHFFLMPSINIETSVVGTTHTIDLYQQYKSQFASPLYKSLGAPVNIPVFGSEQLYFYITYFDKNILDIKDIDHTGKMTYTIKKKANWDTYMNIIFVIR